MSSELLMDAKLIFPSEESITQFLKVTNSKSVSICDHSVEGIFSETVIDTACSLFKAVVTVMPYYLSGALSTTYSGEQALLLIE